MSNFFKIKGSMPDEPKFKTSTVSNKEYALFTLKCGHDYFPIITFDEQVVRMLHLCQKDFTFTAVGKVTRYKDKQTQKYVTSLQCTSVEGNFPTEDLQRQRQETNEQQRQLYQTPSDDFSDEIPF